MGFSGTRRRWAVVIACVLAAISLAACGSSGGTSTGSGNKGTAVTAKAAGLVQTGPGLTSPTTGSGARVKGGTVTFAEAPGSPPNYIFPLISPEYCVSADMGQLNQMLYRPLYWFGDNYSPTVDYSRSIGQRPVFSNGDKVVTIHLGHYMWSNGEQVTARDLVFWMNLLKADPSKEWCAYIPGKFPDNVTSYKAINPTTFQLTLNHAYNPTWFLYNELSQLTPLPLAWDKTSFSEAAPSASSTTAPDLTKSGATAVYNFLNTQSQKISSWGDSPLWGVVDGPWKVSQATSNGEVTFVPNRTYSGSPKPTIAKFVEVPFTSESALVDQIRSQGPSSLSIAYIPSQDQPLTGAFKSEGYDVNMGMSYSSYFIPINLHAPKIGPVFRQLYARQALQHLVDQDGWIKRFLNGVAIPTYGPVPQSPSNPLISSGSEADLYPFSVAAASKLLTENGWKVVPGGVSTCVKPGTGTGECGAGITKGQPFTFNLNYESDVTYVQEEVEDLQSQASKVGIKIDLTSHPYDEVAEAVEHCASGTPVCDWDTEDGGSGWTYDEGGFYPSGEVLFTSTSFSNLANYESPKMNKLINATLYAQPSQEKAAMAKFVTYADEQVPYIWTPNPVGAFGSGNAGTIISNKLGGYATNAFGGLTPEDWYLTR